MGSFLYIPHGIGLSVNALIVLVFLLSTTSFSASITYSSNGRLPLTISGCGSGASLSGTARHSRSGDKLTFKCFVSEGTPTVVNLLTGMGNCMDSVKQHINVSGSNSFGSNSCSGSPSCSIRLPSGSCKDIENPKHYHSNICSHTVYFNDACVDSLGKLPLPPCSSPIFTLSEICKGGQGQWRQTNPASALNAIESAFGEVSLIGNSSSYFQTAKGAQFSETFSRNLVDTQGSMFDILSARSQTAPSDTVTRPDGSQCLSDTQGKLFDYLICPLGFEPPSEDTSGCYIEPPPPELLRKSLPDNYEEPPMPDYSLDWSSKPLYDARGRRTQAEPNTRRYLFEKGNNGGLRKTEPGMVELLREPFLQCCVDSFSVKHVENNTTTFAENIGVKVNYYAKFSQSPGCNPACCEFKQDAKGRISVNGEVQEKTTCKIGGEPVYLNPVIYQDDCYGRGCNNTDGRETYDDASGIFEGRDFPGPESVDGDSVDIRMEFNSYIRDICSDSYEVKDSRYWGFEIQGKIPDWPDSLNTILLGDYD